MSDTGGHRYVSPSVKRVFGYTEDEALKALMFSLVHPEDLNEVRETWELMLPMPGVAIPGFICRMQHQDVSWRWIECTFTNMLRDKSLQGIVDNFRDITERITAEQRLSNTAVALASALSNLQEIMDASMDMICSIDEHGKFVKVSKASGPMLGYDPQELVGQKYLDLAIAADSDRTSAIAADIMNGIPTTSFENRYLHKDGAVPNPETCQDPFR